MLSLKVKKTIKLRDKILQKLSDRFVDVQNGFTSLHVACKKNRIPIIELLLRYGATLEATTEVMLTFHDVMTSCVVQLMTSH